MSKLSQREHNNKRHPRPLPLGVPLSHISPKYYTPGEVWESIRDTLKHICEIGLFRNTPPVDVVFDTYTDISFKINDRDGMKFIWDNGFYGKGILSRSDPTWVDRMQKKVSSLLTSKVGDESHLKHGDKNKDLYSEEITKNRRLLRNAWKKERDLYIKLEKEIKLKSINGEISTNDKEKLDLERERLSKLKESLNKGPNGVNVDILNHLSNISSGTTSPISNVDIYGEIPSDVNNSSSPSTCNLLHPEISEQLRMEDYDVLIDSKNIRNIEYLELDPCEALFLLQLDLIRVKVNDSYIDFHELLILLVKTFGQIIINEYVVYYHFRTLGWCVRNGLKFSCDWVLYLRGPPFSHAEFAIKVINENMDINTDYDNLIDYQAVSRVVSGVKKSLILCFVDGPILESQEWNLAWNDYIESKDFISFLNKFTVNQVVWRRWTPSRTRM